MRLYRVEFLLKFAIFICMLFTGCFVYSASNHAPLKVLLVTGGGFHDYETQKDIISKGLELRANIIVTVAYTKTDPNTDLVSSFDGYQGKQWADGYDVIIHNICSARSPAADFAERVADTHITGKPGVFLHCSLFNFRDIETDNWFELIGLSACPTHEAIYPIVAANNNPEHPILRSFPPLWNTPNGELYKICKIWPNTQILSWGMAKDNVARPIIWTNKYGKARIFGTSLGHHNETVGSDVYLDVLTRGVLWAANKLNAQGEPIDGYGMLSVLTNGLD